MRIPRKRIDKAEQDYSYLTKKPIRITKNSSVWKVIDIKTNKCISKFKNFYDIEVEIRNKKNKSQ